MKKLTSKIARGTATGDGAAARLGREHLGLSVFIERRKTMAEERTDIESFIRDNLAQQLDALQLHQQQLEEPDPVVDVVRRSLSEGLERVAEACRRLDENSNIEVVYRTAGGANGYDFGGFELIDVQVEPKESMSA